MRREISKNIISGLLCPNVLWLLLFISGIGIFLIGMPKYGDDYWFMMQLKPWFESQDIQAPEHGGNIFTAGFPLHEIVDTWFFHYQYDNIRLANIIAPVLLIFPKWAGSSVMLAAFIFVIWGSYRISGTCWRRSAMVPVSLCVWLFIMPWHHGFGSLDVQLNYIVGAALGILIWILVAGGRHGNKSDVARRATVLVVSLIAGMWHEGFSVPLLAGFIATLTWMDVRRRKEMIYAIIGLAVGASLLWLSPGMRSRLGDASGGLLQHFADLGYWMRYADLCVLYMSVAILAVMAFRRNRVRANVNVALIVFLTVSSVAAFIISFATESLQRGATWSIISSAILILYLTRCLKPDFDRGYSYGMKMLAIPLLVAVFVNLALCDYYSLRCRQVMKEFITDYTTQPDKPNFGKVTFLDRMPLAALYLPDYDFYDAYMVQTGMYYLGSDSSDALQFGIVPEELRSVTSESGNQVAGGSPIREYNGYLFMPFDGNKARIYELEVDYGRGYRKALAKGTRFVSERDGKEYISLRIWSGLYNAHFCRVQRIGKEIR